MNILITILLAVLGLGLLANLAAIVFIVVRLQAFAPVRKRWERWRDHLAVVLGERS